MIITRLFLDNLYSFKSAELDLSFTRTPVGASVYDEYLENRPKFYFKKVCILSGANATGKTSLGKLLLGIQNYISRKVFDPLYLVIGEHDKPAVFGVDFVTHHENKLYRLECTAVKSGEISTVTRLRFGHLTIRQNDSCRVATRRLDELFSTKGSDSYSSSSISGFVDSDEFGFVEAQNIFKSSFIIPDFGWHYVFSENDETSSTVHDIKIDILKKLLMSFDPSIDNVFELVAEDAKDKKNKIKNIEGFSVKFKNGENVVIGKTGKPDDPNRLSRGTYESIKVARLLSRVISDYHTDSNPELMEVNSTYFLDEKMAYAHTELEQLILTILIAKLPRYSQFFYTTHNLDILDLNLPAHSYTFLKKEGNEATFTEAVSLAKKNDRSLRNLVQHDCFGTKPSDELLFDLLIGD